ncbi:tetratricopeptide repeat protein [Flavobacterium sp. 14A]|uniref:tetratricopeptide repeat protein n=1 Tax=Flavobacterium sp. 14A TaxID=2735896 RepID=UPI0015707512|nr:tetratricopeptide repeat protein [Flavobacterium sp. 14A]NRT12299.1 tetratricopeptide (TPR) repeat protein [Flavobacterium sp. 14A]
MKNILYLFLLFTQVFFAQSGFETGNELYKNGKYEAAANAYNAVLKSKKQSAELYYNLGNCYYKLNKVAPAIYNYEKALVFKPNDTNTQNNLRFAQKRTVDEIKVVPKVGFAKLLRDFTASYNYNVWGYISVGFSVLFLLAFLGYYFSASSVVKRVFFFGMFVMVILMVISVIAAIFEKNQCKNERPAIVFAEAVDVKKEPQNASKTIVILHEGAKVYVEETANNWKKVQLTDGTEGWIEKSAIIEVK